ncbi:MAG: sensor histidine kinase [Armatimonadota bacterium]|nr:sensor histidine kinase [Armatimonadota bacterium]MDR7451740.1 sensor histidine kinase [Armatimonadota bacterium]MDR7467365.1 sensor histidine kinase [Armatimonadota bacterium]MDR7494135.1 sensor histidine kinase [Armatimonadota bacterium]MDR7498899.1 sensor histidine kinase [Armatimonadota bacterium]
MQRRLQLIILGHIWTLAPLAGLWFLRPAWRGPLAPTDLRGLGWLAVFAGAYLLVRTWLTLTDRLHTALLWPYLDVAVVTAALVLLRSPTDPLSVLYFIPLASAGASLSLLNLGAVAGVAAASYIGVVLRSATPWTIGLVFRLVIIILIASLYGAVLRAVTEAARAAERAEYQAALAREIHDGIQHLLVTMSARLDLAARLVEEAPPRARAILAGERDALRRAVDELRYLVRRLRSAAGGDLSSALRDQIAALAERWPFSLEVDLPPTLPRLSPGAEHALLRVIQEALTNVAKHADAATVEVTMAAADGHLRCTIRDDGRGFDPAAVRDRGLAGLEARVRSAGGSFQVTSAPGQGTTVAAAFPVSRRR